MEDWLAPPLVSSIERIWSSNNPRIIGYQLHRYRGEGREEAIALLTSLLAPCPQPVIVKELVRLKALTSGAKQTESSIELQMALYAEEMERYPADVVRHVCRVWPRLPCGKWWPSWSEIAELLDEAVLKRRALLAVLQNRPPVRLVTAGEAS